MSGRRAPRCGPLRDRRVVELVGRGPAPYAAMLLSDLGADVIRIDQPPRTPAAAAAPERDLLARGRRAVALDLKSDQGRSRALDLMAVADVVLDPFRPGVVERLGVGPDICLARNPRLVYGRMTGWGQEGPASGHAGHDINFVAVAGALAHIGRFGGPPVPPLNLVGDMGGGGLLLAFGVLAALLETESSGLGQVVDVAMVDGVASLMATVYSFFAQGFQTLERGNNAIDSGAPFYDVYECADGRYVSVGPIESRFWLNLLRALELDPDELPPRSDRAAWPVLKERLAATFRTRTRTEWCALLDPLPDVCFAPVLDLLEAPLHPHLKARGTFLELDGVRQPAPVPRFSRTPGAVQGPPRPTGSDTDEVLDEWLAPRD